MSEARKDSISSRLGWTSASCFLHDLQVQRHMSLANYQVLTIKEHRDIKMTRLIERNSIFPTKTTRRFAARSSNVAIQLLEGEASLATQNQVLAELQLEGLTAADSAVDITLDIDANGILRVKAVGLGSGKSAELVVEQDDRHRWSNPEVEHMVAQGELSNLAMAKLNVFLLQGSMRRKDVPFHRGEGGNIYRYTYIIVYKLNQGSRRRKDVLFVVLTNIPWFGPAWSAKVGGRQLLPRPRASCSISAHTCSQTGARPNM